MGHESIATTSLYVHFLGTAADTAGLERLNRALEPTPESLRGARDGVESK